MTTPDDFYIDGDNNPVASQLLKSVEENIAKYTPEWVASQPTEEALVEAIRAQLGLTAYAAGAIADLERRIVTLEGLVRTLMSR